MQRFYLILNSYLSALELILSKFKKWYNYYSTNLLVKFIARAILLALVWEIFYSQFRYSPGIHEFYEDASMKLTDTYLYASGWVLRQFGYKVEKIGIIIRIVGTGGVMLEKGCLGRNLMALFLGFMLMVPGTLKNKLWFIPAGLVSIYCLNVIRICTLAILCVNHLNWIPINHEIIFPRIVQGIIFLKWVVYFKWFRKPRVKALAAPK